MSNISRAVGILSVLLAGTAAPAHAAKPKHEITWLLGHENLDYFEEAAESFKTAVEAGSGGEIRVRIVPEVRDQPKLSSPEIASKVSRGEFEMGHSFCDVMGSLDPRLHVFEAPYLFRDYRHMEGVFEGPIGDELLQGLRSHGLVGLSFTYSGGASGIATAKRELRGPEDLKGLKIAVYGKPFSEEWLKSLGAVPVPIGHKVREIVPGARDGSIDGAVITWRNFQVGTLEREMRRFSLPGSSYLVSMTYINEKFLESLSEDHRKLIISASREAGRIERAKTIELNESSKRALMAAGVRPVYISEDAQRRMAEATRSAVEGYLGRDFVEKVRSAPAGPDLTSVPEPLSSKSGAP